MLWELKSLASSCSSDELSFLLNLDRIKMDRIGFYICGSPAHVWAQFSPIAPDNKKSGVPGVLPEKKKDAWELPRVHLASTFLAFGYILVGFYHRTFTSATFVWKSSSYLSTCTWHSFLFNKDDRKTNKTKKTLQ